MDSSTLGTLKAKETPAPKPFNLGRIKCLSQLLRLDRGGFLEIHLTRYPFSFLSPSFNILSLLSHSFFTYNHGSSSDCSWWWTYAISAFSPRSLFADHCSSVVSGLSAAHTVYLNGGNVLVLDKQSQSTMGSFFM